jgi:hypothetical protein
MTKAITDADVIKLKESFVARCVERMTLGEMKSYITNYMHRSLNGMMLSHLVDTVTLCGDDDLIDAMFAE